MSELIYTALTTEQCPWKEEADRVFEIDTGTHAGKVIKVRLTRHEQDINGDGVPDQLNVKVVATLVEKTTGVPVTVAGHAIETPGKVDSVRMAAIAEGEIDVISWMADLVDAAIFRVLRKQAAMSSYALIPTE